VPAAAAGGSGSAMGLAQHTEFVTPDLWPPGTMPSAPSNGTAVFYGSVYGNEPCCDNTHFPTRWNYQEYLVGEQHQPGGPFEIDWTKSTAADYSSFTPSNHSEFQPPV
jgi:hypothetical protein